MTNQTPPPEDPAAPPPKRLRFFRPEEELPPENKTSRNLSPIPPPPAKDHTLPLLFSALPAILGSHVSPSTIALLKEMSDGNITRAINYFYDGSYKNYPKEIGHQQAKLAFNKPQPGISPIPTRPATPSCSWTRKYLGCLGCEAIATTSGRNLIAAGDIVKIERPIFVKQTSGKTHSLNSSSSKRLFPSTSLKTNTVVRIINSKGKEIAKLATEWAGLISTLIDLGICEFDGICIYSPELLAVADCLAIQIRCFVIRNAFGIENRSFERENDQKNMDQKHRLERETDQEGPKINQKRPEIKTDQKHPFQHPSDTGTNQDHLLKARRLAILKLFNQINLEPSKSGNFSQAQVIAVEKTPEKPLDNKIYSSEEDEDGGKQVESDQLDALYKKAQLFDLKMPTADPPSTFKFQLRHYQKQALYWMSHKEMQDDSARQTVSMHPLWQEYHWPTRDQNDSEIVHKGETKFYMNPYSGELSLEFPAVTQACKGGILADEMGLGKTIEMLSLIHLVRCTELDYTSSTPGVKFASNTTLVVAPMSLLSQWKSEAEAVSRGNSLSVLVYYGNDKHVDLSVLCTGKSAPNVVITSYGVVQSEWSKLDTEKSPRNQIGLFAVEFFRIILDEAHLIKNRASKTARACYHLEAKRRWVLTGTPIVNKLEDLYSLVNFLGIEPWGHFSYWRTFITVPFESGDYLCAMDVVQTVLEPLVLRRTKDMKDVNGNPIVVLPDKVIEKDYLELSSKEREIYDLIYTRAKQTFTANVKAGTILKNYTTILSMILRLRQCCDHPSLVKQTVDTIDDGDVAPNDDGLIDDAALSNLVANFNSQDKADKNTFGTAVIEKIKQGSLDECPYCFEPIMEETITPCWHMACKPCFLRYIETQKEKGEPTSCFQCREPYTENDLYSVIRCDPEGTQTLGNVSLRRFNSYSSAKLNALLGHLISIRRTQPGTKCVVFSQFTSFLNTIEHMFKREGIKYVRLDGSIDQKGRTRVLDQFKSHTGNLVLLLSLKAGGVGLNLVAASRAFMMDPYWNFATESQAIDRIHRMGQTENVRIVRFIVKDSIEERMLVIQDRKNFVASSLSMTNDERKLKTLENIKLLFE
ncbi:DNA repair protein RAD5 [Neolecta irregularis DAH-3]|uniref:DNA repair protein RAD5 n=1 Tax=Neolecta irregularis (strain DAH-3) TaxID=1198029 RepID=A0A1U7LR48_NEOID|nr:DNA repair protein RAD5 [Neolecta irregularis DAH-3]|eukprot:OLL25146.1 DNA repair protein RAD5 [Neolecta irregularis DAH-3]